MLGADAWRRVIMCHVAGRSFSVRARISFVVSLETGLLFNLEQGASQHFLANPMESVGNRTGLIPNCNDGGDDADTR
jgi:hypothetical protein